MTKDRLRRPRLMSSKLLSMARPYLDHGDLHVDEEEVLELVIAQLLDHPASVEVMAADLDINFVLIMDALDVLKAAGAIQTFRETHNRHRVNIYALKSASRTWTTCKICKGTGEQSDQRRCLHCKGQGIYTPHAGIRLYEFQPVSPPNGRSR